MSGYPRRNNFKRPQERISATEADEYSKYTEYGTLKPHIQVLKI